jgi:ArsR family transcriptional regulator, arsenate/arsenite/antimonite-responsive transcriptional repressor
MSTATKIDADKIALAMSDPLRLKILDVLAKGPQKLSLKIYAGFPDAVCCSDIKNYLGDVTSSRLSYHLKELKDADLIQEHRNGKWIFVSLDKKVLAAFLELMKKRFLSS